MLLSKSLALKKRMKRRHACHVKIHYKFNNVCFICVGFFFLFV